MMNQQHNQDQKTILVFISKVRDLSIISQPLSLAMCIPSCLSTYRAICFQSWSSKNLIRQLFQKVRGWSKFSPHAFSLFVYPSPEAVFKKPQWLLFKSPLQSSSLSLPLASIQVWLSQVLWEMRRGLSQKLGDLVSGPPATPSSLDKSLNFSKPQFFTSDK